MARKKTHEEFLKDVYDRLGSDYEVLSPYPGGHGKVQMKHFICNNVFEKNVHDIITKSSGCPYCNGAKPAKYNEQWVKEHTEFPYSYVSGYVNMKTKCVFHCDKCGVNFLQMPTRLINEKIYGCNCSPNKKLSHKDFLALMNEESKEEYTVLDEYKNMDFPIRFKHNPCGAVFQLSPYKFLYRHNQKYCPICYYKKSRGEIAISQYLQNNCYSFQKEVIFYDLPNLRFDFYLPKENILIEFDGKQHYEAVSFFGGEEALHQTQIRDEMKNQYSLSHNIPLFRIPWTEIDSIPIILHEILKEKSSTTIEKFLVTEQSRE